MDVCGNVWEWTSSPYPVPSGEQERRIVKGESYLCADNYCMRYRPSAVMGQTLDSTGVNDGLRNLARPILVALENMGDRLVAYFSGLRPMSSPAVGASRLPWIP